MPSIVGIATVGDFFSSLEWNKRILNVSVIVGGCSIIRDKSCQLVREQGCSPQRFQWQPEDYLAVHTSTSVSELGLKCDRQLRQSGVAWETSPGGRKKRFWSSMITTCLEKLARNIAGAFKQIYFFIVIKIIQSRVRLGQKDNIFKY